MKIRKVYENISNDRIDNYLKLKNKLENEETIIKDLIFNFIMNNLDILTELKEIMDDFDENENPPFVVEHFYIVNNNFTIYITWDYGNNGETMQFSPEQYKEFTIFMNNPDVYKDTKKYNL